MHPSVPGSLLKPFRVVLVDITTHETWHIHTTQDIKPLGCPAMVFLLLLVLVLVLVLVLAVVVVVVVVVVAIAKGAKKVNPPPPQKRKKVFGGPGSPDIDFYEKKNLFQMSCLSPRSILQGTNIHILPFTGSSSENHRRQSARALNGRGICGRFFWRGIAFVPQAVSWKFLRSLT